MRVGPHPSRCMTWLGPDRVAKQSDVQAGDVGTELFALREKRHRARAFVRNRDSNVPFSRNKTMPVVAVENCSVVFQGAVDARSSRPRLRQLPQALRQLCTSRVPVARLRTRSGPSRLRVDRAARLAHEERQSIAKVLRRLVHVVRPATELQVLNNGLTAVGVRPHVMELQKSSLRTATVRPDERAPAAITVPHLPPDRRRNVARPRDRWTRSPRAFSRGHLRPLEIREQHRQRPIEDRGRIAVRNRMPQQILRAAQLVVRLARNRELHLVALRREGPHNSGMRSEVARTRGASRRAPGSRWRSSREHPAPPSAPEACARSLAPRAAGVGAPRCARRRACSCDEHGPELRDGSPQSGGAPAV